MNSLGALKRGVWTGHGAPHVRHRTVIVSEAFLGLLEMPADNIDKRFDADLYVEIEGVKIVDRDLPRINVPLVILEKFVISLNVRRWNVVYAKHVPVQIRVDVSGFLILVKPQRLMMANGEGGLLRHVRFEHLRSPPAVICLDERLNHIVQQTRQNNLLGQAVLLRQGRALKN